MAFMCEEKKVRGTRSSSRMSKGERLSVITPLGY